MSNVFSFVGICGKDGEIKHLPSSGQSVLNVSLANNIGFGDKQQTIWVRVALWGKRAESVAPYVKKGQQIFVSGELSTAEYKDNQGVTKISLELNANVFDLVGGKKDSSEQSQSSQHADYKDDIIF